MNFIALAQQFMQYWSIAQTFKPTLETLVANVEAQFGATPGQGPAKLAAVEAELKAFWASLTGVSVTFEQIWPFMSRIITTIVSANNIGGKWTEAISAVNTVIAGVSAA